MSLAEELLSAAHELCDFDRRRPRQVSLRRSISTAYYALFHLLVQEASRFLVSGERGALRAKVSRSFNHATMRKVCRSFANPFTAELDEVNGDGNVPEPLRRIAGLIVTLQQQRHQADYDQLFRISREEVREVLREVSAAFNAWADLRPLEFSEVFLAALAFSDRWNRA